MSVFGVALFTGLLGCACLALGRRAMAAGVLAPIVLGGALRLWVMAAAHVASVDVGDNGILFVDDQTYFLDAQRIATEWRSGHLVDPGAYEYVGNVMFGFTATVAGVFTLVGTHIFAAKLLNVLLGTATILLVAILAERLLGIRAKRPAAWLAALLPGFVWWSAPMLKEALGTFLVVAILLAAAHLPRRSAAAWLGASLAALAVVRSGTAVALALSL